MLPTAFGVCKNFRRLGRSTGSGGGRKKAYAAVNDIHISPCIKCIKLRRAGRVRVLRTACTHVYLYTSSAKAWEGNVNQRPTATN